MLLVSDDNTFKTEYNVDDQLGARVDIPTVIVQKRVGDLFKEYLNTPLHEKVILSIKFSGVKEDGMLEIDLFFRSDDIKALHFFTEFENYYKKLSKNLFDALKNTNLNLLLSTNIPNIISPIQVVLFPTKMMKHLV